MRCEQCGREIRNAEMWQLTDPNTLPAPRTMRTLCRQCRQAPAEGATSAARFDILAQANDIVRQYEAASEA